MQFDINLELLKVQNWMRINKLTINYKKTNYMILIKKKLNNFPFVIKIGENAIDCKQCVKYLGIMIDEKMSWADQINYLYTKICRGAWAIEKVH